MWTIWKSRNDIFFSEWIFSVECLVDRMKLLSWKWFIGKNHGSPVPFMSGVSTLLYVGTGRVCLVSCWVSIGQGDQMLSSCFVLPLVGLCLSLSVEYSSCRGDTYEGF
jgi:hypothetical protein